MIGEADTLNTRPQVATWQPGYAKGALDTYQVSCTATGLSYAYDTFDTVDDWIMVHGKLRVSGGATSDVYGPVIGYAAGRHKTQMLTDNARAAVTIQDGVILLGESRVFICADEQMNAYYGMAISKDALGQKVAIIRGQSSISVDHYEWTTTTITAGDEFMVWYDRKNSTVRVYKNDTELCSKYFAPTDIPHGPGARWTGVVMSCRWLLDQGPRFDTFEAQDVQYADPVIHDAIDSPTVNPGWVEVAADLKVNRHLFAKPSLGPKSLLLTAARWTTPVNTDSVRVTATLFRETTGRFRIAVRSNTAMTNWVGVQFNATNSTVQVVTGSGPTTVTTRASEKSWFSSWQTWTVTWNDDTKTIKVYRGGQRTPLLEWAASTNFTGTGRYVGLSWTNDFLSSGVEPMSFDAWDVTMFDPID